MGVSCHDPGLNDGREITNMAPTGAVLVKNLLSLNQNIILISMDGMLKAVGPSGIIRL